MAPGPAGPPERAARRIVVWRHGRTAWNAELRYQGQLDIPLDGTGREQARRAAASLAALHPDAIVSSDLCRASACAAELAALCGLDARTDPALRERHGGHWEGMTMDAIGARFPTEAAGWQPGDGESAEQVAERATIAVRRMLDSLPGGGTGVVVTHGSVARALLCHLTGLPPAHWQALGPLGNAAWSVLAERADGNGWRLAEHNAGAPAGPVLSDDR
jgi:probable phosphoglycerate mutase